MKLSECFKVPTDMATPSLVPSRSGSRDYTDDVEVCPEVPPPLAPPDIPGAISTSLSVPQHAETDPTGSSDTIPSNSTGQGPDFEHDQQESPSPILETPLSSSIEPRRSSRLRRPPARFADYVTDF